MACWLRDFPNDLFLEVWNEPYPYDELYEPYFLPKVVEKVHSKNDQIQIVCMPPGDWGSMLGFIGWEGISYPSVVYSTYIYEPYTYTHQGLDMRLLDEGCKT